MRDQCPRGRCPWQDRATGLCHWPGENCPYKAEKEQAAKQRAEARQIMEAVRAKKHKQVMGIKQTPGGQYRLDISKDHKRYYIGTYETIDEAIAARKEAKAQADLEQWIKERGKAQCQSAGT